MHDPERRAEAEAARRAGGVTTGTQLAAQKAGKFRSAQPDQLPTRRAPRTLSDVVRWASWCATAAATGLLDGVSVREINRSLQTLQAAIHKADLLRRIRELEKVIKRYEQERARSD